MTTKIPDNPDLAQAMALRILIRKYTSMDTDIPDNPDIVWAVELCTHGYGNLKESDESLRWFLVPLLAAGNALLMNEDTTASYVKEMFSNEIGYTHEDLDILVHILYNRGYVALSQDLAKWAYQKRPKKWRYLRNSAPLLLSCGLTSTIRRRDIFYFSIRQLPNFPVKALWGLWRSPERMSLSIVDCLSTPPVSKDVVCDMCGIKSEGCIKSSCGHLYHQSCAINPVLKTWKCPNGCDLRQYLPILPPGFEKHKIDRWYIRC